MPQEYCCDQIIGGKIWITATFSDGSGGGQAGGNAIGSRKYEALGEVRIQPARIERTAGASSNGTVWAVEAARPARIIMSFVNRCNHNPLELYCRRCRLSMTVLEMSRGFFHSFQDCIVVGAPEVNLSTGEISGMEIVSDDYDVHPMNPNEDDEECKLIPRTAAGAAGAPGTA